MSTYKAYTQHPYTKEYSIATWMDDHYGHHRYGVRFENGDTFEAEKHDMQTKTPEQRVFEEASDWYYADNSADEDAQARLVINIAKILEETNI